jgi:murein tripeptide amidase MpaA
MIKISSAFNCGNIVPVSADNPGDIQVKIRKDTASDFFQWFYFRVSGVRGEDCAVKIVNAGEASYAKGFAEHQVCASYDLEDWFRVPTEYDGKVLTVRHRPEFDSVYYALFAPYPMERHRAFIAACQTSPRARLEILGETVKGREIDLLTIGEPGPGKRVCWAIARQHPGETMGQFWMEGFLGRLLDEEDALATALLEKAVFHVVPNMNPDGAVVGNLRTNAAGANLNREWAEPSLENSPEVFCVRARMVETGVDFLIDVHGDETIPHVFISGADHVPSADERMKKLLVDFKQALLDASPDFQTEKGYPAAFQANLAICASNIAESFKCLAMTLEMPFADHNDRPDARHGWSPERSDRLGFDCLEAIAAVMDDLREE